MARGTRIRPVRGPRSGSSTRTGAPVSACHTFRFGSTLLSRHCTSSDPEYLVRYYRGERDPARTPHASRAEAGVPHEDVPARPAQEAKAVQEEAKAGAIEQPVAIEQPIAIEQPGAIEEPAAPPINTLEALATTTGEVRLRCTLILRIEHFFVL